jgi:hypothetical protein
MCFTYLPQAFPLHTFASTGTPSVIWGVTWEPRPSHALCMVCGLGPANPLGFGLSRVLLPSLRQVASVTLGLCLLLVSLDTFLISSLLLGCGRALEARGGEGGRPKLNHASLAELAAVWTSRTPPWGARLRDCWRPLTGVGVGGAMGGGQVRSSGPELEDTFR